MKEENENNDRIRWLKQYVIQFFVLLGHILSVDISLIYCPQYYDRFSRAFGCIFFCGGISILCVIVFKKIIISIWFLSYALWFILHSILPCSYDRHTARTLLYPIFSTSNFGESTMDWIIPLLGVCFSFMAIGLVIMLEDMEGSFFALFSQIIVWIIFCHYIALAILKFLITADEKAIRSILPTTLEAAKMKNLGAWSKMNANFDENQNLLVKAEHRSPASPTVARNLNTPQIANRMFKDQEIGMSFMRAEYKPKLSEMQFLSESPDQKKEMFKFAPKSWFNRLPTKRQNDLKDVLEMEIESNEILIDQMQDFADLNKKESTLFLDWWFNEEMKTHTMSHRTDRSLGREFLDDMTPGVTPGATPGASIASRILQIPQHGVWEETLNQNEDTPDFIVLSGGDSGRSPTPQKRVVVSKPQAIENSTDPAQRHFYKWGEICHHSDEYEMEMKDQCTVVQEINIRTKSFRDALTARDFDANSLQSPRLVQKDNNLTQLRRPLLALVAHDAMKPLMATFADSYRDYLKMFRLTGTGTTVKMLTKIGLECDTGYFVASGPLGGDQILGAMIAKGDIDALFFFQDPLHPMPHISDVHALSRLCNVYQIYFASNYPSASACLEYVYRAMLDTIVEYKNTHQNQVYDAEDLKDSGRGELYTGFKFPQNVPSPADQVMEEYKSGREATAEKAANMDEKKNTSKVLERLRFKTTDFKSNCGPKEKKLRHFADKNGNGLPVSDKSTRDFE